jgi:hypothetical protein
VNEVSASVKGWGESVRVYNVSPQRAHIGN